MIAKILSILFLFYLSSTYCGYCSEKTTFEEEEEEYRYNECKELNGIDYYCHYDRKNQRCEELYCKTSSSKYCDMIPRSSDGKRCIAKSDESGCEYKSCSDLTSNCNEFYTGDEDQICTLDTSTKKCEIKKCSEASKDKCGELIPYDKTRKCALNEDNKCQILVKNCEEFNNNECYRSRGDGEKQCLPDTASDHCKLYSCEELSNTECNNYKIYDGEKVCAPKGDKCQIQTCSDFTDKEICESVKFFNRGIKCAYSDSGCILSSCYNMDKSECGNFIPSNKIYKCYYDNDKGKCQTDYKNCEEFSSGECDFFNIEDNLEGTNGKKCVEDDGKCVLNSKNVEFSAYFFLILFLLF